MRHNVLRAFQQIFQDHPSKVFSAEDLQSALQEKGITRAIATIRVDYQMYLYFNLPQYRHQLTYRPRIQKKYAYLAAD